MTSSSAPSSKVEAILARAAQGNVKPVDTDISPVYSYLLPSANSNGSSFSSKPHWYCSESASALHTRCATYLLFLFAFKREGTTKVWVDKLEEVTKGCEACAAEFGAVRRRFGTTYMSGFPPATRMGLYAAIDKWQGQLLVDEAAAVASQSSGSYNGANPLSQLSPSILRLLFAEPSLLDTPAIADLVDRTIINELGSAQIRLPLTWLSPLLVRLLSSTPERRELAMRYLQRGGRRPSCAEAFEASGTKAEMEALYRGTTVLGDKDRWTAVRAIVEKNWLSPDAIDRGLLSGAEGKGFKDHGGIMSTIAPMLGAADDNFPVILDIFTALLRSCNGHQFWSFDSSPELPHTLISDIRNNSSYRALLETAYPAVSDDQAASDVSRGKSRAIDTPFAWTSDFLLSLLPAPEDEMVARPKTDKDTGFAEALATMMSWCFQDMQHTRYPASLRAAAAEAGLSALMAIPSRLPLNNIPLTSAFNSTMSVHAPFISAVAFRSSDHPGFAWESAREAARETLTKIFQADGRDILESTLTLSVIATEERKRLAKVRKAKQNGLPSPLAIVASPHKAAIRKELWSMAYNSLLPTDAAGAGILIKSIASFAHIEKLNRNETWGYEELRLKEAISEEDFVAGIRAINNALQVSRDPFGHAMESLAMQADQDIITALWKQEGVARAAVTLLLSPADDVHDPTIGLIQQSFDNVDDRGDCFRVLLRKFPSQAMSGLCDFLTHFIDTATRTPESCSLAKWLVRCFTDILDALCLPSQDSMPLLQSSDFLQSFADHTPMSKRVSQLWQLMTTALAVIFKRTIEWAPFYDNETMVDWMRDALIFGRQMTERIRDFESASLGIVGAGAVGNPGESPARQTMTGAKLVQKLELVLRDLVSWLRLTDVETLHQTFELTKTIVGRIAKTTPDVSESRELKATLLELEKFSRKAGKAYRSKLSDDLLSELSDLIEPFNLDLPEEEVVFIGRGASATAPSVTSQASTTETLRGASSQPSSSPAPSVPPASRKNAFDMMMGRPASKVTSSSTIKPASSKSSSSTTKPIDVDEFDDIDFLSDFTARDLDIIEKGGRVAKSSSSTTPVPRPGTLQFPKTSRPQPSAGERLNINVVPKPAPRPSGGFKSSFMRDAQAHFRQDRVDRDRVIGGVVPAIPKASNLGTGLGAYQGQRKKPDMVESSGSSASDSSDEDRSGLAALAKRRSPKKAQLITAPPAEKRSIKIMGTSMNAIINERESRKAAQYRIKQRLRPDLGALIRYILAWSPVHDGPGAPHPPKFAREIGPVALVPTTYPGGAEQYRKAMLPLFLQELWEQCKKESDNSATIQVEIVTRTYEGDFVDLELFVQGVLPHDFHANDSDIVILRYAGGGAVRPVLARVIEFKRKFKATAAKVRILNVVDCTELNAKCKWQLSKYTSLNTALREYGALQGLPFYEPALLHDILHARSAPMPRLTEEDISDTKRAFDVNEPQAKAILGAMSVEGFALIQGPPGTGKTKTISGLVGKFLSDRAGAISINGEKPSKAKLLVCAPSNAAIDEVCKRLMNGVPSAGGGRHNPSIVRIGIDKAVNIAVKDVALDNLVEARISAQGASQGGGDDDYARIQQQLNDVKAKIQAKQEEMRRVSNNDEARRQVESELQGLIQKRTQLGQQSSKAKDASLDATRHMNGARRAAREEILKEADIICATLSGAGQDALTQFTFETVIIDEAAQAIEMSCLIPLKYGCKRCIMVGDPNQLPPTTFSVEAERMHYNESLFVRIAKQSPANVQLLSIQYRMNPFISELPSKVFYNGQLQDGPGMAAKTAAIWHEQSLFGAYRFFNVDGHEVKQGTSTKNPKEAQVAVNLYRRLEDEFGVRINFAMRIGVISMYKEQVWELKRHFTSAFGGSILERIEFNTVDGFQGQEKDIIILSTVRSGPNLTSIGFLKDPRRMNVALTRAKSSLFVIGNAPTLERSDQRWRTIVGDARDRGFLVNYDDGLFSRRANDSPEKPRINGKKAPTGAAASRKPANAYNAEPPKALMDGSVPLKRKASDSALAGNNDDEEKKKRKREKEERKAEKRRKREERASREGSPMSIASSTSSTKKTKAPKSDAVDKRPNGSSAPSKSNRPSANGIANGAHTVSSSSPAPNASLPPPPPPTEMPPPPPPPAQAMVKAPPPKTSRPIEDILFVKKKKKLPGQPPRPGGGLPNVRAAINDRLHKR